MEEEVKTKIQIFIGRSINTQTNVLMTSCDFWQEQKADRVAWQRKQEKM